jgi:hypothetical protein
MIIGSNAGWVSDCPDIFVFHLIFKKSGVSRGIIEFFTPLLVYYIPRYINKKEPRSIRDSTGIICINVSFSRTWIRLGKIGCGKRIKS